MDVHQKLTQSNTLKDPLIPTRSNFVQNQTNGGIDEGNGSEGFVVCLPVNSVTTERSKRQLCVRERAGQACNSNHSQVDLNAAVIADIETGNSAPKTPEAHIHFDLENKNPVLFAKIQILQNVLTALGSQSVADCGHVHGHDDATDVIRCDIILL
jgi:hypothetical protein